MNETTRLNPSELRGLPSEFAAEYLIAVQKARENSADLMAAGRVTPEHYRKTVKFLSEVEGAVLDDAKEGQ